MNETSAAGRRNVSPGRPGGGGTGGGPGQPGEPGELLRLVAGRLEAAGLEVHLFEKPSAALSIAGLGERCVLIVTDDGRVQWEYRVSQADPARLADIADALLTGRAGRTGLASGADLGLTLKGIVGRDLRARGLTVELNVYGDDDCFDAQAEIVVSGPGADDGEVCLDDDGFLDWTRDYWREAATVADQPGFEWWIADPAGLASDIAAKVVQAVGI